jgi:hypothetical protein
MRGFSPGRAVIPRGGRKPSKAFRRATSTTRISPLSVLAPADPVEAISGFPYELPFEFGF